MNKKLLSFCFATGLIFTSVISASAASSSKTGSCGGVGCSAVLTLQRGNSFAAGTYSNKAMQNISVELDGDKEWWGDTDTKQNATTAYMQTTIASGHAYSTHHADNGRGDDFDRKIDCDAGIFN
ncbi:hypothetical protein [Clostridium estertheticum]|uniref:hypothetical protein n=1 Tax=Clostridium estertheticum TaxID=238834 RepID=UPI00124CD54B|nr:hypothetical protein [Clostridium estertheticum]MBZ9618526.1 hypothetical protein [Clostridium estertheticum subsp. laramiense]MCB2362289.1 hypothetical protein [Clostridium estertheticum]WAG76452.1 hypothetical protein LL032_24135 [Clostridium estertheticum]